MLPITHRIAFLLFGVVTALIGARGFYRLYRRIRAGRDDADERFNRLPSRLWYALTTTLLQKRTFRKRPVVSFFHALIFYAFVFYLLVNFVDGLEGYFPFAISSASWPEALYNLMADVLSTAALIGVLALVIRRFLLPARHDFRFNKNTLLHEEVRRLYISRDSLIVSAFILFHVGSRAVEAGAKLALHGRDRFQPFASGVAHVFTQADAENWRIYGYWGALGSVLVFLMYFPYSKHVHLFIAPLKYMVAREPRSGVLPAVDVNIELSQADEEQKLGANKLENLGWPRLLDAYACIQCNRCQDVCPATATGKSLSPAALEINKRMELNRLARQMPKFEAGAESPRPLLDFALSPEAAWACTTCGACMQVCPVEDEQMLDIVDIRRHQVMIEGDFPAQLQNAFRGMERAKNPWGINHDQRMAWAEGMKVPTIDENPEADVLYWVGCAASYDPQAQKTARAFVQLLTRAGVDFAVLGKRECCTGDSARRAGNEYLYRELAEQNIATLNAVKPRHIVATCPHCMNTIGKEYRQLGGNFDVVHHTEFLEHLVAQGRLLVEAASSRVTYHDPCYLGRHNGVFDAPRNVLRVLSNDFVELDRRRENSFCCGAGGGQFWKEEEAGTERIAENRFREVRQRLDERSEDKVLAVGCPFCKSMLGASAGKDEKADIAIKDVAELLLEGVLKREGNSKPMGAPSTIANTQIDVPPPAAPFAPAAADTSAAKVQGVPTAAVAPAEIAPQPATERKKWTPKNSAISSPIVDKEVVQTGPNKPQEIPVVVAPNIEEHQSDREPPTLEPKDGQPVIRKKWVPKK